MPILSVKCHNYKIHKDLDIPFNGRSAIVMGDSGIGKWSLIEIILISLMMMDYPPNPLTDDAKEGWTELLHEHEGQEYKIFRKYKKVTSPDGSEKIVLDRWSVTDKNNGKHSLESVLTKIMGPAFKNKYFDYNEFFIKQKSTAGRFDYLMRSLGGDKVLENIAKYKKLFTERKTIGSQRNVEKTLYEQSGLSDPEIMDQQIALYQKPREFSEADQIRDEFLEKNLIDYSKLKEQILDLKAKGDRINTLQAETSALDVEIKELALKLKQLQESREAKISEEKQLTKVVKKANLSQLSEEITAKVAHNNEVKTDANKLYNDEIKAIGEFNTRFQIFHNTLPVIYRYEALEKEWQDLSTQMTSLKEENKKIFKESLPIPELTICEDENGDDMVCWNGRELAYENLSGGERIKLTAQIQRTINPGGFNFVVIPEAQSLGSKLKPLLDECAEFDIQAIVEMTDPAEQEIRIDFIEAGSPEGDQPAPKATRKKRVKKA